MPEQAHGEVSGCRLGDDDHKQSGEQRRRRLEKDLRVEQHADRDEEQNGKGIA